MTHLRAEAVVDLAAIRHNVTRLREVVAPAQVMVVVKADGYGHGMVAAARAARQAGAPWLGAATLEEALDLRAAGDTGPVLTWLAVPGESYTEAVAAGIDVTASSSWQLADIIGGARAAGRTARLQIKVDTGLSRNGAVRQEWSHVFAAAASAPEVEVTGIWSHFACSDEPDHPSVAAQEETFRDALAVASNLGLAPTLRHLANSAGALLRPSARFDLVRCGIAAYGLTPAPHVASPAQLGLRPAMTLRGRLAAVKQVRAGAGVSYGHTFVTDSDTRLGLVPLGYGEGIPRHASNRAYARVGGVNVPIAGRVCMDQFVVDLGSTSAAPGDEVICFGPGADGEPTAQDWADAAGTISYEIVTRLGGRIVRTYVDEEAS